MREFRLSPDVSVLVERGAAESRLVADLLSIGKTTPLTAEKVMARRLIKAFGVYDQIGYEIIQAVYDRDHRLVL